MKTWSVKQPLLPVVLFFTAGILLANLVPLPLAGLISGKGLAEVSANFADLRTAIDRVVDWQPPYLVFKACFGATLACNSGPHQTDRGIADVSSGRLLETPLLELLD